MNVVKRCTLCGATGFERYICDKCRVTGLVCYAERCVECHTSDDEDGCPNISCRHSPKHTCSKCGYDLWVEECQEGTCAPCRNVSSV